MINDFANLKESATDKAKKKANREIKEMAERLSADQSIIVISLKLLEHCDLIYSLDFV